jgi:hypothetical protein
VASKLQHGGDGCCGASRDSMERWTKPERGLWRVGAWRLHITSGKASMWKAGRIITAARRPPHGHAPSCRWQRVPLHDGTETPEMKPTLCRNGYLGALPGQHAVVRSRGVGMHVRNMGRHLCGGHGG